MLFDRVVYVQYLERDSVEERGFVVMAARGTVGGGHLMSPSSVFWLVTSIVRLAYA